MKKTIERVLFSLFLSGTLLFSGCSTDDEEDELVGNWKKISDFEGVARCSAVAFTVNGTAYIATGGYGGYKYRLDDLWAYNEANGTWTQKASMPATARTYAVGFGTDRAGYVGLGYDGDNYLRDFWKYDPANNEWSKASDFGGSARRAAVAFSVGGVGYVGCGYDGNHLKDFWKYDETADSWVQVTSIGGSVLQHSSSTIRPMWSEATTIRPTSTIFGHTTLRRTHGLKSGRSPT